MLTDRVATYGGNNKTLARKRKISNERLFKTDQISSSLSFLATWVSDSSDEKLDDGNEDEDYQPQEPIAKKHVKTGGELNKDFFQNKQIVSAKILKLSATDLTYFLNTLVKVG